MADILETLATAAEAARGAGLTIAVAPGGLNVGASRDLSPGHKRHVRRTVAWDELQSNPAALIDTIDRVRADLEGA